MSHRKSPDPCHFVARHQDIECGAAASDSQSSRQSGISLLDVWELGGSESGEDMRLDPPPAPGIPVVPLVPPAEVPLHGEHPGGVDGPPGAHIARAQAWGPYSISEIHRSGVHVGWGANCNQHHDPGHEARCKKSITFGGDLGVSSDQCVAKLKLWLLEGEGIDSPTPRTAHVKLNARAMDVLPTEQLDQMCRDLGHEP